MPTDSQITSRQTIQQQRASYALKRVNEVLQRVEGVNRLPAKQAKEFRSYVCAIPAMIHMNGLGQATAFYRSKKAGDMHRKVYELLSDWLCQENRPYNGCRELLDGITELGQDKYRLAQAEAQAFMSWVVKFTKAFVQDEATSKAQEKDNETVA